MRWIILPAVLLFLVFASPGWSGDLDSRIDQVLGDLESIAGRLASQKQDAPEDRRASIRQSFVYSVNKHAERLARETDAGADAIDEFRADAEAIGREHGLID